LLPFPVRQGDRLFQSVGVEQAPQFATSSGVTRTKLGAFPRQAKFRDRGADGRSFGEVEDEKIFLLSFIVPKK